MDEVASADPVGTAGNGLSKCGSEAPIAFDREEKRGREARP